MKRLIQAAMAPVIFELCGIVPVLLVLLGILNIGSGISLQKTLVVRYSPIFFIAAAGFFIFSIYAYLKQKQSCNLIGLKRHQKPIIFAFTGLIFLQAILLIVLNQIERITYKGITLTDFSAFFGFAVFLFSVLFVFIFVMKLVKPKGN